MEQKRASKLKNRIYEILEVVSPDDRAARMVNGFILSLIGLNVVVLVFETVEPIYQIAPVWFRVFEIFSVMVFSVEYTLRMWSCVTSTHYASPIRGRLKFAFTPMALIDLFAVLPFYLPFLGLDLRFIRAVRLFRFFRVAKIARYSRTLQTFSRVLAATKEQLLTTIFLLLLLLLLSSSLMYFAERDAQPEFFQSIPAAMWWGVITLTTVGYGDVVPVTIWGKMIASIIAVLGIGIFALPTGILGAAFVQEIQRQKIGQKICPHCGKVIEE